MLVDLRRHGRRGVTAIEYGLIAALIIVAILGVIRETGTNLATVFGAVSTALENVIPGSSGASPSGPYAGVTYTLEQPGTTSAYILGSNGADIRPSSTADLPTTIAQFLADFSNTGKTYNHMTVEATTQALAIPGINGLGTSGQFTLPQGYKAMLAELPNSVLGTTSSGSHVPEVWSIYRTGAAPALTTAQAGALNTACTAAGGTGVNNGTGYSCQGSAVYPDTTVQAFNP